MECADLKRCTQMQSLMCNTALDSGSTQSRPVRLENTCQKWHGKGCKTTWQTSPCWDVCKKWAIRVVWALIREIMQKKVWKKKKRICSPAPALPVPLLPFPCSCGGWLLINLEIHLFFYSWGTTTSLKKLSHQALLVHSFTQTGQTWGFVTHPFNNI